MPAQAAIPLTSLTAPIPRSLRITEGQLTSIEKAERIQKEAEAAQNEPHILELTGYVKKAWQAAYSAKQISVQERLLLSARQRKGEYDPGKWGDLRREGGSEIYMMLTNQKCRFLESWLKDVELPPGQKPWSIDPTPVPELPPSMEKDVYAQVEAEVTQLIDLHGPEAATTDWVLERLEAIQTEAAKKTTKMATKTAKRIERIIEDQLVEGGYYEALYDFITDFATYPAAILKGPVIRKKPKLVWTEDRNGNNVAAVEEVYAREYSCISPHDAFPSPGSKGINDGYFIERLRLRRRDLEACYGVPGFNDIAIKGVLNEHGTGGLREWLAIDQEREWVEDRENSQNDPDPPIEGLEFWGSIQGKLLLEWGMDKKKVPDANHDYQISCWLIGKYIVMARLNPHPLGKRPYYVSSYEKINGSFWGQCPPELMRDLQLMCNGAARALVNNLGIACLTGDTIVYQATWGGWEEITIDELRKEIGPKHIKLKSLNEETSKFFANSLLNIFDKGIAQVFEIETKHGYKIRATGNHRFMTSGMQWQKLHRFKLLDLIAINDSDNNFTFEEIVSVKFVGQQQVYDLQMAAPNHNFIANGYVSHNSGPMVEIDIDRMVAGSDPENLYPWKVFPTKDPSRSGKPAVHFYQPNPLTDVLIQVYEYFANQASKQTGIPDYIGNQAKGVVASTLSMLMNAETKALKGVVMHIDKDIIKPSIREHWLHIMLNDRTIAKMGDINVVARASEHMIVAEQIEIRTTELLNATNNPVDMAIMGLSGRATLLREKIKSLKIPSESVIPDEMEMERRDLAIAEIQKQEQLMLTQGQETDAAGGVSGELTRLNQ